MLDASLFPSSARFSYLRTARGESSLHNFEQLHPLEKSLVTNSVDVRRAEFGDARWCAHSALSHLGCGGDAPILKGERGMPLWPEGVVGSVTHTDGFRAAVVAPTRSVRSIGLDAEPAEPLPDNVLESIARPAEIEQLDELRAAGVHCADRLLFCAKESTYKSWFPMTHRFLDFDGAEVDIREDGTFVSYLMVRPAPVPFINGRWKIKDGFVVASTFVEWL